MEYYAIAYDKLIAMDNKMVLEVKTDPSSLRNKLLRLFPFLPFQSPQKVVIGLKMLSIETVFQNINDQEIVKNLYASKFDADVALKNFKHTHFMRINQLGLETEDTYNLKQFVDLFEVKKIEPLSNGLSV